MIEGSLSRRYSKALYELARESQREESIGEEIAAFLSAYGGVGSELPTVLNNPALPLDGRKKILIEVARSIQLTPLSEHFLLLLLERDRLSFLPAMVSSYRRLLNAAKGRVEAKIISPTPLESSSRSRARFTTAAYERKWRKWRIAAHEAPEGARDGNRNGGNQSNH
jgi:F-type H+-transporting ATPase subunit delta